MVTVESSSPPLRTSWDGGAKTKGVGLADLLRLFGAGASGAILLGLRDGPLRTKALTTRVPGFGPRTVYRYVERLVEIGAIEREEEPGVPSKVIHHLTDPCGVELSGLIDRFARTWLEVLPDGGIVPHSWGCLTQLGDLWESEMFKKLNGGPCTATELARLDHDLSFHQVSRRINLFMASRLLRESDEDRARRHYELTQEARRRTALIAGLGRWRARYVGAPEEPGLTADETAELLRAALPLITLPDHVGKSFELSVAGGDRSNGDGGEVVWAEVAPDGSVACTNPLADVDGRGRGEIGDWIKALLQGSKVRASGDRSVIKACMERMHAALWRESSRSVSTPAAAEAVTARSNGA